MLDLYKVISRRLDMELEKRERVDKVTCPVCGWNGHILELHFEKTKCMTIKEFREKYPEQPELSSAAAELINKKIFINNI